MTRLVCFFLVLCFLFPASALAKQASDWFETFKASATDKELHQLLYEMPKGGDLHQHLSGAMFSKWWLDLALNARRDGYEYYTRVELRNCRQYGYDAFGPQSVNLMFHNLERINYEALSSCEKSQYLPLAEMSKIQAQAWLESIRLDKSHEGRDEFFETHWQRLGDLTANPWIRAEGIFLNMRAFADEGLLYMEPQVATDGYRTARGKPIAPEQVAAIFRARLNQKDALATGVTVRFQQAVLRFLPDAEQRLEQTYQFVASNWPWVGVNLVGREDNDKGYPLRFLHTLRALRQKYHGVRLSIHAGEVDEPNSHVRDTLLLGADRIGHGLNLITDPQTMLLMRHGPYLVEINLISNLLLEYIDHYQSHPFPEYLRTGIPVALSTDDRGMWDSTMTDEFFVAVKEFNLSWSEIKQLSRNSISYSFLEEPEKGQLMRLFEERMRKFEAQIQGGNNVKFVLGDSATKRGFICRNYHICSD